MQVSRSSTGYSHATDDFRPSPQRSEAEATAKINEERGSLVVEPETDASADFNVVDYEVRIWPSWSPFAQPLAGQWYSK
jgi:hypothetical protein